MHPQTSNTFQSTGVGSRPRGRYSRLAERSVTPFVLPTAHALHSGTGEISDLFVAILFLKSRTTRLVTLSSHGFLRGVISTADGDRGCGREGVWKLCLTILRVV